VKWAEVKDIALPILERYTARTNGSSVRLRDPGIAWSYYSTDPEWGLMQAKSVIVELEEALAAHDVSHWGMGRDDESTTGSCFCLTRRSKTHPPTRIHRSRWCT